MDIFTKEKRSEIMSRIKGKGTKLEERAWSVLTQSGIRFRKHPRGIPGKPDAANKSKKLAIFVDSEFWHGFNWANRKKNIKSNRRFWIRKIESNILRDKKVNRILKNEGWKVVRIWEKELKKSQINKLLGKVSKILR